MADYFVTDRLKSGARQVDDAPMQAPPSANLQSLGTVTPEDRAATMMRPPLDVSGPSPQPEGTRPLVDVEGEYTRDAMRGKGRPAMRATARKIMDF